MEIYLTYCQKSKSKKTRMRGYQRVGMEIPKLRQLLEDRHHHETPLQEADLTREVRACLAVCSGLGEFEVDTLTASDITFNLLARNSISYLHLKKAQLHTKMGALGVQTPDQLHRLGVLTLDFVQDAEFARACCALFTPASMRDAFLVHGPQAVMLAGEEASLYFNAHTEQLLQACEGDPACARCVLLQLPSTALNGVHAKTLLATGLCRSQLLQLGFGPATLSKSLLGTPEELLALANFKL